MTHWQGKNVWIIGAGHGIGRALALELARGGATLILSGRNQEALQSVNSEIGGRHAIIPFDITDGAAADAAAARAASSVPVIDSVIVMAGSYAPMPLDALDMPMTAEIVQTNLMGPLNVVHATLPVLLKQKTGQLALCASVAGYRGLPNAQPYAATKAAVINLAESLRAETLRRGLDIRVINPGYVRTRLTDKNNFAMPMILTPEQAAKAIAKGLTGRAFEIHFPLRLSLLLKILSCLPDWLYFRLVAR